MPNASHGGGRTASHRTSRTDSGAAHLAFLMRLAVVTLTFAACGGGPETESAGATDNQQPAATAAASPETSTPTLPPVTAGPGVDAEQAAAVAAVARPVASALASTLQQNLVEAMQANGPVGAMAFCNVEALPLTQQVSEEQGMVVKRTSWRLRNPANAPDELEGAALAHFAEAAAAGGGVPADWVQADPAGGFRYYKALPTGAPCVQCHGAPEQLAEGIPEALAGLYPMDQAVNFAAGKLRGLLRVAVPAEAVEGADR